MKELRATARWAAFGLCSVFVVWPASTGAQRANYNDVLVGGLASGMGGTYTGVAADSSAVFHNPAGLAHIMRHDLSLSVNAYGFQRSVVDKRLQTEGTAKQMTLDSVLIYPSATSWVIPLGGGERWNHSVAISALVPEFFEYEGVNHLRSDDPSVQVDLFTRLKERLYLAGPSYGIRYDRFYFGASLFVQYLTLDIDRDTAVTAVREDGGGGAEVLRSHEFQHVTSRFFGLTGNVGALVRPVEGLALGVNLWLPNVRLGGKGEAFAVDSTSSVAIDDAGNAVTGPNGNPSDVTLYQDVARDLEGDSQFDVSPSLSLGASYTKKGAFIIAGDVDIHFAADAYDLVQVPSPDPGTSPGELGDPSEFRGIDPLVRDPGRDLTVNGSVGASVVMTEDYWLQLGAFTDLSAVPNEGVQALNQTDYYGGTVSVTRSSERSLLTAGIAGRYGTGTSFALDVVEAVPEFTTTDIRQWALTIFVSGSTQAMGDSDESDAEKVGSVLP